METSRQSLRPHRGFLVPVLLLICRGAAAARGAGGLWRWVGRESATIEQPPCPTRRETRHGVRNTLLCRPSDKSGHPRGPYCMQPRVSLVQSEGRLLRTSMESESELLWEKFDGKPMDLRTRAKQAVKRAVTAAETTGACSSLRGRTVSCCL